jgi:hypothetical protein
LRKIVNCFTGLRVWANDAETALGFPILNNSSRVFFHPRVDICLAHAEYFTHAAPACPQVIGFDGLLPDFLRILSRFRV